MPLKDRSWQSALCETSIFCTSSDFMSLGIKKNIYIKYALADHLITPTPPNTPTPTPSPMGITWKHIHITCRYQSLVDQRRLLQGQRLDFECPGFEGLKLPLYYREQGIWMAPIYFCCCCCRIINYRRVPQVRACATPARIKCVCVCVGGGGHWFQYIYTPVVCLLCVCFYSQVQISVSVSAR